MSACIFLASDHPLKEMAPSREYPLVINLDEGAIFDGGADDNFFLRTFADVMDYTDRKYGVSLEWNYTEGRANRIIGYIKDALRHTDCVELWQVWLLGWYEYEDRPVIHRKYIPIGELMPEHIKDIEDAPIWNTPDKRNPERPSFYCLTVTP